MTDRNPDETTTRERPLATDTGAQADPIVPARPDQSAATAEPAAAPRQLGVGRYVLAGFFAAGIGVAYLTSQLLSAAWNKLADNPWLSQHVPVLTRIAEDERPGITMVVGAVLGIWAAIYAYRRDDIRNWTNEVAAELAKVTWPSKKEVTNSTIVVIVTSAFATVFLALLDRFWNFVTNLVYGS
jgi:preprotein translocase subunit SecE